MPEAALSLVAIPGIPAIRGEGELPHVLAKALAPFELRVGDVLVVTQKVVSKSEGRYRFLDEIVPSAKALGLAQVCGKPAAYVQAVLDESVEVVRCARSVLITRSRLGHVVANAGIDQSNISDVNGRARVLLLPEDPDRSARALREHLRQELGAALAIVISDSFGRPWRVGTAGACVGVAGLAPVYDLRGRQDLFGRPLEVSQQAVADELASAASLLMGQADEGLPVVLVRGFPARGDGTSRDLVRPAQEDLFR